MILNYEKGQGLEVKDQGWIIEFKKIKGNLELVNRSLTVPTIYTAAWASFKISNRYIEIVSVPQNNLCLFSLILYIISWSYTYGPAKQLFI